MAAFHELARALRDNFVDESANIQLSSILKFIENYVKTSTQSEQEEVAEKQSQNAKLTRKNTTENASKICPTPIQKAQPTQQGNQETESELTRANKRPSYAEAAKKAHQIAQKPRQLPKSLQNSLKPIGTIKITLRNPIKETPKDLIDRIKAQQGDIATAIIAMRPITARHLLIYPRDEKAKTLLLGTKGWLNCLQADLYTKDYPIVIHGIDKALQPQEVIQRLQDQNTEDPGLFIGAWAQWIGKKPTKKGTIRVALKSPIRANRAIQQGLILDYEIK